MTYDPLSYGQIKLGGKVAAPGESPEDLLFEDAAATPRSFTSESDDTDWSALDTDIDSLRPMARGRDQVADFGADILGEALPQAPRRTSPVEPQKARIAAPASPTRVTRSSRQVASNPNTQPTPGSKRQAAPNPRSTVKTSTVRRRRPAPRASRWVATLVPSVLIAFGGSASAWFYLMDQNLVMAAMVAATSLVGAALARVMFR